MRAYTGISSGLVLVVSLVFLVYGLKTKSGLLITVYGPTGWMDRDREPFKYWAAIGEWASLALVGAVLMLAMIVLPD